MKTLLLLAFSLSTLAMGNAAYSNLRQHLDDTTSEHLGALCDAGSLEHCQELVRLSGGQCAGPEWSGCAYTLEVR